MSTGEDTKARLNEGEMQENPWVCLSIDAKNAFNCINRHCVFDAIVGTATRAYDACTTGWRVEEGDAIVHPPFVHQYVSCFETYYGEEATLTYIDGKGKAHFIKGQTGVQQGDPPSGAMYAIGQHPTLLRVAERHREIYVVVYADNVFILGRLSNALACAADLVPLMHSDLSLEVNLKSSWVFAPAWAHFEESDGGAPWVPPAFNTALNEHPSLSTIKLEHSTLILGTPFGTPKACARMLDEKAVEIADGTRYIRKLPSPRTHYQMLKYCILSQFHYLQRTLPPSLTTHPARKIDEVAFREVTSYRG